MGPRAGQQVLHWIPTDIRCQRTQFGHSCDLEPGICTPLVRRAIGADCDNCPSPPPKKNLYGPSSDFLNDTAGDKSRVSAVRVVTRLRGIIMVQWGRGAVHSRLQEGRYRSAHGLADCCKFRVGRLLRSLVRRRTREKAPN